MKRPIEAVRHPDAAFINTVLNDTFVRPWVATTGFKKIDVTNLVIDKNNVLLCGAHGGCLFIQILPGIYELHTQILRQGRGAWAQEFIFSALDYMFTQTNASEILTRVPAGNLAARTATLAHGGKLEFSREKNVLVGNDELMDVEVYRMTIPDWVARDDHLRREGEWFHERLHEEAQRLGITAPLHEDDSVHNRYVGAALRMIRGGQVVKGIWFYNRWAIIARHSTISVHSEDPLTIKFDLGLMQLDNDDIKMV